MAEKTVVLYPSLGVGHLNPMAQLAKALLRRGGVAVTIAVADPPDKDAVLAGALARLAATSPSITVQLLPISLPPDHAGKHYSHPIMHILDALRAANPTLKEFLRLLPAVDAFVVDMFCTDALDVATELAIPSYTFYPSAAGDLAVYLQVPQIYRATPSSFRDMGKASLSFFGVSPVGHARHHARPGQRCVRDSAAAARPVAGSERHSREQLRVVGGAGSERAPWWTLLAVDLIRPSANLQLKISQKSL
jgi:hypothetical protein